jgi:hypothetical protein
MELFNTNAYATSTSRDFELEQSTKKGKRSPIFDSAWEDGSAFPGLKNDDCQLQVGNRITAPGGRGGVIQKASCAKYQILWDNGFPGECTLKQFEQYGYQKNEEIKDCPEGDRWNPEHFNSNPEFKADGDQLTIFLEETGTGEPPEPDDFKSLAEYEKAWETWEKQSSLHNSTYAVGSASGSLFQESKQADLSLLDSPKLMITAQTSYEQDSQEFPTLETLTSSQPSVDSANNQTVLQHRHHVNRSVSKESVLRLKTLGTASRQSSESSSAAIQNSSRLKMSEVCSVVPLDQEQKNLTLDFSSGSFPAAGMMSNGLLYQVEPLERPILEKGCSWLESPGALSSVGRSPGRGKLESSLVKKGILNRGQVANPIFLEESFGIPQGWTDPLECRAATELLEEEGKRSAMHLTPELERSPSQESSICTKSPLYEAPSESNEIPEKFLEETKKDRRRGCLYKYLENKKLKDRTVASYPRVLSDRDPDNPKHWRWGFNWEEKKDGEWKGRSIGSLPVGLIPMIQSMQKSDVPLQEIIDFIRRSKGMKNK